MPETLRTRLRYPQQIFAIQAAMFTTFHMTNPAVFYNREDQWEIPTLRQRRQQPMPMHPYYTIMKLPGESGAEYIQMLPFTPRGKDNLAAWMVARSDGGNYGKLAVFQFPKQTVIFGPKQVAARINQDQVISPQITLWNQQGSEVIQGTLLVIPDRGVADLHPPALPPRRRRADPRAEARHRRLPEQHRHGRDADGGARADPPERRRPPAAPAARRDGRRAAPRNGAPQAADTTSLSLAEQARAHYARALQAQRDGNWALYGEEIKKLGEVLERMRKETPR